MFKCGNCAEVVAPKVKPVFVIMGFRDKEYTNTRITVDDYEREHKELVTSHGSEITSQAMFCPPCANVPEPVASPNRKVKAKPFEEIVPAHLKVPMLATIVHNALERTEHQTKRAAAECAISIPLVKDFVDRNKGYVF